MDILNIKKFEEDLYILINTSGVGVAEGYYIVSNAALRLKELYNQYLIEARKNPPQEETDVQTIELNSEENLV